MKSILRLLPLVAAATLAACAVRSSPTAGATADAEQAVLAAHEQRRVATLAADVAALDSIMTADLTFTHPNGVEESKAEFLGTLRTGTLRYQSITDEDRRVRIHGDAAVVSGVVRLVLTASGLPIDIRVRFTELWTRESGSWRMVLWHAAAVS
jgi:ketosteroid isomerase-like protein